jgi:uncharacterized protein YbjT (DUF2867 family)
MQNFNKGMRPRPAGDGAYFLANIIRPETQMPLIDITDTGKWIAPMLLNPGKYEGEIVAASTKAYTMQEVVDIMSKVEGKKVVYKQLPEDVFRSHLPASRVDYLVHMMLFVQDFGYYGAQTEELVAKAVAMAHGPLTTFEEYLQNKGPLGLE